SLSGSLALVASLRVVTFRGLRLCLLRLSMVPTSICRFILMLLATGWAMAIVTGLELLATGTICSILFLRWIVLVLNIRSFIILTAILTGLDSGRVLLRRGFVNLACWVISIFLSGCFVLPVSSGGRFCRGLWIPMVMLRRMVWLRFLCLIISLRMMFSSWRDRKSVV